MGNWGKRQLLALVVFIAAFSTVAAQRGGRIVLQEWYPSKPADSAMMSWTLRQGTTMTTPRISRSPRGIRLLGPYGAADALRLTLKGLPRHSLVRIELGWHIIGPWQGTEANDRFMVMADGRNMVDATFSNTASTQTWPDATNARQLPPRTRTRNSNMLGYPCTYAIDYSGPMDATYETINTVSHSSSSLTIDITSLLAYVKLDSCEKLWGIDHVVISVLDAYTESELPTRPLLRQAVDAVSYTDGDVREIAEFVQDGDFPGLISTSALAKDLHVTYLNSECHSCGDVCLMYHYRLYTDGWMSVWSNRAARGKATFSMILTQEELDTMSMLLADCAQEPLTPAYHDSTYEAEHPDLTHCELVIVVNDKEAKTEVFAGEPPTIRRMMNYALAILERRGWSPIPK